MTSGNRQKKKLWVCAYCGRRVASSRLPKDWAVVKANGDELLFYDTAECLALGVQARRAQ